MTAHIGQPVTYIETVAVSDGVSVKESPAVVTNVIDEETVNLIAFVDGQGAFPKANVKREADGETQAPGAQWREQDENWFKRLIGLAKSEL